MEIKSITGICAVAVAFCLLAGGALLARGIHADSKLTADEKAAKQKLSAFLSACKSGNEETMLNTSLAETVIRTMYSDEPEEAIDGYLRTFLDGFQSITGYQIGAATDCTAEVRASEQTEKDLFEMTYYLLLDKGKTADAEVFRTGDNAKSYLAFMDYYGKIDTAYSFHVKLESPQNTQEDSLQDTISVVRYQGEWLVQPLEYLVPAGLSDEQQEKLAAYREKYGAVTAGT